MAGPSPSGPPDKEPPETGEPFVPRASIQGDQAVVDLTFPDGTMATISYPAALDLAGMGVQPDVDLAWEDRWVGALVFTHGPPDHRLLAGAGPLTVHRIDGRPVEE